MKSMIGLTLSVRLMIAASLISFPLHASQLEVPFATADVSATSVTDRSGDKLEVLSFVSLLGLGLCLLSWATYKHRTKL